METKPFYQSRIFWVNFLALGAFGYKSYTGKDVPTEIVAYVMAILTIVFRVDTNESVSLLPKKTAVESVEIKTTETTEVTKKP